MGGNVGQTQPPAPAAPSPNGGAPAAAPAAPWYGDLSAEPDLKGWAELKKPADAVTALKGWRDSEKLIGGPKDSLLRLPDANAKPEDWNPVYDRLGRPKAPTDYKLPTVQGGEEFASKMAPLLHSAGLNQRQVDVIANGWNQYMEGAVAAQEAEQAQREQADLTALHTEWSGDVFAAREGMARVAVREFVMPIAGDEAKATEMLGQIEDAIGTAAFLKLFAGIGEKVGESKFVDSGRAAGFGMTPAAARARIDELKADKEWGKRWYSNPKGPEAIELDRLERIAILGRTE